MTLEQQVTQPPPARDTMLTIGVFDGVHRGHRHLFGHLLEQAASAGHLAGVVTFRNHPASVLRPGFVPLHLTTVDERIKALHEVGFDLVVPLTFDLELSKMPARDFVTFLRRNLRMAGVVIGPDFAMGHQREGDTTALKELGRRMGFTVSVVQPLFDGDLPVRSNVIREALAKGDVATAAKLLGRDFVLGGTVAKGFGRGAGLGFPTANLAVPPGMAVPGDGIYAAWAHVSGRIHMAAASIGNRPTFEGSTHAVEAYILDFDGDLYGDELRLQFVRRLRDEVKYDTVDALLRQMETDVAQTRQLLGAARGGAG